MNKRSTHHNPVGNKNTGGGDLHDNQIISKIARTARTTVLIMATLLLSGFSLSAQQRVTGTVSDDSGVPLPGATVAVVGTGTAVLTDTAGAYSINVPGADASLEVSYLGYISQTVSVGNRTTINITMQSDATASEDVVVIGYGTMQKRQVTSSIQSIGGDDMPLGVGGSSIATQLQGKVAGLVMSGTDTPNSGNPFQLRGMASMHSGRAPLIVIDGMPDGDIRSLSPEEIQSIDVLKDASSGAIYGTRATGGVILVTTKKGKVGAVSMSYTGEVMLKKAFGAPDMLGADDYMRIKAGDKQDFGADTDWWDEALTDNPTSHRHVVTLQGGSDQARIYANMQYGKNVGVLKGDSRKDYSGRMNADFKLLDGWLDISARMSYRQAERNQNKPNIETLLRTNPTQAVYDPSSQTGYNIWVDSNQSYEDMNEIGEAAIKTRFGIDKWFRPDMTLKLNIKPISGLSYTQTAGYENRSWENQEYDPSTTRDEQQQNRKGRAKLEFSKTTLLNTDGYFTFIRDYGLHSLNATLGYGYHERNGQKFDMTNYDFSIDKVGQWNIGEGSWLVAKDHNAGMSSKKEITYRLLSYFARANWSFNDKYMASASIRYEASSKFPPANKWGTFWSVSGGWRISREEFMKNVSWVNDLKLRVAFGVTGVEPSSLDYSYRMFVTDTRHLMPDGTWSYSYGPKTNLNPELKWEEKHEWNVGLDFTLFNDRLWGSVDWYRRGIKDMLFDQEVPTPPNVHTSTMKNIGDMKNQGIEVILNGHIIKSNNWSWVSSLNLSHNKTTMGNMAYEGQVINSGNLLWVGDVHRLRKGADVGSFFIYRHAGFDETGKFMIYGEDGSPKLGSEGNEKDRVYVGNYNPTLIAGWNNSIGYKNWSLDFTITSWIDFDIYNAIDMFYGLKSVAQGNVMTSAIGKYDHITGSPVATTYFLQDGTFIKLQNLTLGYTLPLKNNKYVKSAKVYFTGHNLARWTKFDGLNPEVNITGWENGIAKAHDDDATKGIYPQTRTFTFGVQLNF